MCLKEICFLTIFAFISIEVESARILAIFPTPSISHQIVFRPLTQALAKRGHDVTVLTPDPVFSKGEAPSNLTEIDVHDISYATWQKLLSNHRGQKQDIMHQIRSIFESLATIFDLQLQTPEMKEILKKDRNYYDLIIIESCVRTSLGFAHIFDAPLIQFSSFGAVPAQYNAFGAPMHPLLYPTPGSLRLYNLSAWERGVELFKYVLLEYLISFTEEFDYNIMRKYFGKDVPIFDKLSENVKMFFVNEHPIWVDNRPVPPNIQFIGGIYQAEIKELPKDLKSYLDSSKHGVIYVSFGTNVLPSLLPPERIKIMTKVFSELPYNVLFKWDTEDLPGKSDNIKTFKWIPQSDVLRHPNVKLFVTQGGLQSTYETIEAGVPVVGIPMLGDQWYNVEKYTYHKIGQHLDLEMLDKNIFKNVIETVINDKSYKQNTLKLRSLMREHPIKPLDRAVWWTEHIINYGGEHIQPLALNMGWFEYYEIKLVLIVLALSIICLAVLVKLLLVCVHVLKNTSQKLKLS